MSHLIIKRNYSTFSHVDIASCSFPVKEYLSIDPKKLHYVPYPLTQIAIKKTAENTQKADELQITLINGSWDTSDEIPSIVAEVQTNHHCESFIPNNLALKDNSDDELEATNTNLSWLMDFKFPELPPIPGMSF